MFVGAHGWARAMAKALWVQGFKVLLVDSNRDNIYAARMEGLATYHGNILWKHIIGEINLDGIGRLLALTSNNEANSLEEQPSPKPGHTIFSLVDANGHTQYND